MSAPTLITQSSRQHGRRLLPDCLRTHVASPSIADGYGRACPWLQSLARFELRHWHSFERRLHAYLPASKGVECGIGLPRQLIQALTHPPPRTNRVLN